MNEPKTGEVWRHWKGGEYVVCELATDEMTGRPVVVYRCLADGRVWVRDLAVWMQLIGAEGKIVQRFERVV